MRQTFFQRLISNNAQFLAKELRKWADQLDAAAPGPPVAAFPLVFYSSHTGGYEVSDIQVNSDSGPLTATASFLDARGNPTQPGATPEWSSSDENVATVEASGDGLTATVTVTGTVGASQITCLDTESADVSEDDVLCVGTVSVVPGQAVVGDIQFSEGG
jgi:hypothetical protein